MGRDKRDVTVLDDRDDGGVHLGRPRVEDVRQERAVVGDQELEGPLDRLGRDVRDEVEQARLEPHRRPVQPPQRAQDRQPLGRIIVGEPKIALDLAVQPRDGPDLEDDEQARLHRAPRGRELVGRMPPSRPSPRSMAPCPARTPWTTDARSLTNRSASPAPLPRAAGGDEPVGQVPAIQIEHVQVAAQHVVITSSGARLVSLRRVRHPAARLGRILPVRRPVPDVEDAVRDGSQRHQPVRPQGQRGRELGELGRPPDDPPGLEAGPLAKKRRVVGVNALMWSPLCFFGFSRFSSRSDTTRST